jgi:hypothetical protein
MRGSWCGAWRTLDPRIVEHLTRKLPQTHHTRGRHLTVGGHVAGEVHAGRHGLTGVRSSVPGRGLRARVERERTDEASVDVEYVDRRSSIRVTSVRSIANDESGN